jgi:ubiquinone/menaquinone biosynthesis C-methylase UbiE
VAQWNTKQVIRDYWDDQAASFDDQFLHSIATEDERRAWARILDLLAPPGHTLDVLDVGCGTGFLALLFAERGHRVTGIDVAPQMIERARAKATAQGLAVTFRIDDAEALQDPDASYDLVVCRHLLWTLPHPQQALAEWVRVTRPGGRVAVIDGEWRNAAPIRSTETNTMHTAYGEDVVATLPFYGGAPAAQVMALMEAVGLRDIRTDPLQDLIAAQLARMTPEERERHAYVRHVTFGDRPPA